MRSSQKQSANRCIPFDKIDGNIVEITALQLYSTTFVFLDKERGNSTICSMIWK